MSISRPSSNAVLQLTCLGFLQQSPPDRQNPRIMLHTRSKSGLRPSNISTSAADPSSCLLPDIPFQICFIILTSIIGPLYLALWTFDILLVGFLDKIYSELSWSARISPMMDLNTRPCQGPSQVSSSGCRRPDRFTDPTLAEFFSDFDFKESNLDLSLDFKSAQTRPDMSLDNSCRRQLCYRTCSSLRRRNRHCGL